VSAALKSEIVGTGTNVEGGGGGGGGGGGKGGDEGGDESAAQMKVRDLGPSLRLWVSSVPKIVDSLGLGEAPVVFATGSGNTLWSTWSDKARIANAGAVKQAARCSSAGST
jgi:hypothetical protein